MANALTDTDAIREEGGKDWRAGGREGYDDGRRGTADGMDGWMKLGFL
jgi:hypothetical protein